jgi:hypothetical protein
MNMPPIALGSSFETAEHEDDDDDEDDGGGRSECHLEGGLSREGRKSSTITRCGEPRSDKPLTAFRKVDI